MTEQPDDAAYFAPIDDAECASLLRSVDVGRVAWLGPEGISIMPVNYSVINECVVFHTAPGSPLAALVDATEVGFQVDEIDHDARVGWTVLVRGTTGPAEASESVSWVPDDRRVGVAITVGSMGGRVVSGRQA